MKDEFLTITEVCEELKISRKTLDRWRAKQKIPYYRIGSCQRFKKSELHEALESCKKSF